MTEAATELALNDRPSDLMGVRQCAAALQPKVHASTISRQLGAGLFTNYGTTTAPLLSLAEVTQARAEHLNPAQQRQSPRRGGRKPDDGYHSARASKEQTAAKIAELDLAERMGQLLPRDQVEDAFADMGRKTREAMTQMARRVMSEIEQAEGTEAKIAVLTQAIEGRLTALATEFDARGDTAGS